MTTAYNPRADWAREARQPVLGPLVDGDLCDIRIGRGYCGADGVRESTDVDGTDRILCAEHVAKLFPRTDAAQW
jgi:hypothetical protein